ncbi:MAG: glycine cleavage system aminomethyltransferase GcvT [Deltaproteobacteria bacterium]|nr:MAG: glycine cleavage system aminomethyltransferase GcvT [Deltaproteobacteria bacterium]
MASLKKTVLYDRHLTLGAQMVEFGGWDMPIQYPTGIISEHLLTRKEAGLFDVSHMGRVVFRGAGALSFLQHLLTNNAAALEVNRSQYTIIGNRDGGAVDDAYLYRFRKDAYLLVINAGNREKDLAHFKSILKDFPETECIDQSDALAMISLQGPRSKGILHECIEAGMLPDPLRNALATVTICGAPVQIARTGYTGEPLCFELFVPSEKAPALWDLLIEKGAHPVGLGARDTLRLESALPLYGHELGDDPDGKQIPIFALELARVAVSFSPLKGNFIGRVPLKRQFDAFERLTGHDYSRIDDLPFRIRPIALTGRGVARAGSRVSIDDRPVGVVTSGTMVPFWKTEGTGAESILTDQKGRRAIGLALLDSRLNDGDPISIDIRGKKIGAVVVPYHLRSEAPPYARAVLPDQLYPDKKRTGHAPDITDKVHHLLKRAVENSAWRQQECINLIPSEQTASTLSRCLTILDPSGRYAEHKKVKAFYEADVFYYQGADFISEVEQLLQEALLEYLGCRQVETRTISGQMANTTVFSALVDYLNRADRKNEQRRIGKVFNHHIIRGGHLSAQPMGALRDFVARDPQTEKPAVINFPVLADNPYQVDLAACEALFDEHRPELIIMGRSMTIHREPVAELRKMVDDLAPGCILMYDMAHVLGLVGPHFQNPFAEGADIVTGSTHKTFFGTQRGIVAADWDRMDGRYPLWEAIERRAFPGGVSNHHLGTLLGLLMATYEMNHFRDDYQRQVIANAKAFARALADTGLDVAGDSAVSFTETHQVILNVGYAQGPEIARRLEDNNIILNYQASPVEEGFTASGSLRMGVAEMTRFGMIESDFGRLAGFMRDVILDKKNVKQAVTDFRRPFLAMRYCFHTGDFQDLFELIHGLI